MTEQIYDQHHLVEGFILFAGKSVYNYDYLLFPVCNYEKYLVQRWTVPMQFFSKKQRHETPLLVIRSFVLWYFAVLVVLGRASIFSDFRARPFCQEAIPLLCAMF